MSFSRGNLRRGSLLLIMCVFIVLASFSIRSIDSQSACADLVKNYFDANPQEMEPQLARHPIGYLGEPIDIAYGVVFLASDESKFMLGSELVIDGGYLI